MKGQKGITLVALIITIVVLLILAMVAITSLEETNLINQATAAGNKWTEEQGKENNTLIDYENKLQYWINQVNGNNSNN